jgi:hypothetical protein
MSADGDARLKITLEGQSNQLFSTIEVPPALRRSIVWDFAIQAAMGCNQRTNRHLYEIRAGDVG